MTADPVTTTEGALSYLAPQSTVLRRFTAPGHSINTGEYDTHVVTVSNGRPVQDTFDVDVHGFTIAHHRSAVTDFTDKAEVDAVYVPEVVDFVQQQLGADAVASRGWVLRRTAAPGENASQPQAGLVHCDYSPSGAAEMAAAVYAEHFPDGPGFTRAVATSTWRAFSAPPQDWPLALCDFRSVALEDGLDNTLYFVDRVPEDPFGPVDGMKRVTSGSEFFHNPAHRWWYFPDMTRDEVLFFKFHDSDHSRAWRVPHSAFSDSSARATVPRHSIEFRTIAFFD
ncbi:hypothetical protein A7K94_0213880 [Modestobacter sp. VKM Ac-2676]|nr:hypothetical protein A7K94_0213880 [Modestobacter sp. VKM Ac-2676]